MDLKKEQLLDMYKKMVTIRAFELKAVELFAAGQIPGFVHLYLGEEAIATGRLCQPGNEGLYRQYPSGTWPFDRQRRRYKNYDG